MALPTIKQELAFKELLKAIKEKRPFKLKEIMRAVGYTKATAHNPQKNLLTKDGWQQLLAKIDDRKLLDRLYDIALDKNDKRACLQSISEIFKLKDKYPAGKLKLGAFEDREKVLE